ncbi:MAG: nitric oxide reductase [Bdellovibrionaceae bacterium]|jgi:nitric oxide reductase NorE protein|nr:nitric oxide reductase [Pseudobdellovibrionaceae bacterium]
MNETTVDLSAPSKDVSSLFYPHGGLMIWMFVVLELLVFGMAFGVYFYLKNQEPNLFYESQAHLNQQLATINTLLLISSGYVLAIANRGYKQFSSKTTALLILITATLGIAFLIIKLSEYKEKMDAGLNLGVNSFYDVYWLLTGFHAAHVLVGIIILFYFSYLFFSNKHNSEGDTNFDTVAVYWHMCDIIWILLFPIIYLL